jgi:hypothetical protein
MLSQVSVSNSTSKSKSALLEREIDETVAGLQASFGKLLCSIDQKNAGVIVEYISALRSEVNLADTYRRDVIVLLCKISKYTKDKPFRNLVRSDVLEFLDSYRKTETEDPMHKWIGTFNIFRMHLLRFFKWLYAPEIEPKKRQKPPVVENIQKLRRKEKSIYKPSDQFVRDKFAYCKKYNLHIEDHMMIVPVPFSVEGAKMLQHAKYLIEETDDDGLPLVAIHKKFDKLLTGLRTAVAEEYRLNKTDTVYADLVDAFRLALTFYKRAKE